MSTPKGTGLVERAVREALGTLVSPTLCEQLITRSLAGHGLASIPEGGSELREWLENGLRSEVETTVGPDAADLLVGQLGPIAAYATIAMPRPREPGVPKPTEKLPRISSLPIGRAEGHGDRFAGRRISQHDEDDEPERPTALRFDTKAEPDWDTQKIPARSNPFDSGPPTGAYPNKELSFSPVPEGPSTQRGVRTLPPARPISAPPPPKETLHTARPADAFSDPSKAMATVLTATTDARDLEALRRYLNGSAHVQHVPDLVGLLDALETGLVEPIVLIDCQRPTVHVTSVAAIGEDLPKGTTVVLWGADDATWSQIDRERTPLCRWVRCSREATTDDVGSLCSMLLG